MEKREDYEARVKRIEEALDKIEKKYNSPTWTRTVREEKGLRIIVGGKK